LAVDLLNPSPAAEARKHKLKRLVQSPNSFFMDVKCTGCVNIQTVFSHAQTVVQCTSCSQILCKPTGGKARLTQGAWVRVCGCVACAASRPAPPSHSLRPCLSAGCSIRKKKLF
jgi:small subunit ribosomal protein S27e